MSDWGQDILRLASNIYWVIGIFFLFTFFLHVVFVFLFPLSLRAWKLVDYLWLMLAFLSTLGLVGEAKQYRAENAKTESEWSTKQSFNEVRGWFTNYQILVCNEAKILKAKNLNDTSYQGLCDYLEKRINDLNLLQKIKTEIPELNPSMTAGLSQYTVIIPTLEQKVLNLRIARYNEKRALYLDNQHAGERTRLQRVMVILAPVMFALALAIRFTKVTAEYMLLRPNRRRDDPR